MRLASQAPNLTDPLPPKEGKGKGEGGHPQGLVDTPHVRNPGKYPGDAPGPIKTKLGIGTHVDPRSVLVKVKVKVIYLCVLYIPYNRIHDRI